MKKSRRPYLFQPKKRLAVSGLITLILAFTGLVGCSSADSELAVALSTSNSFLIPGTTTSCLGRRTGVTNDISGSYMNLGKLTFTKKDTTKDMYITAIKVMGTMPSSTDISCIIASDELAALSSSWYSAVTTGTALIAAGTQSIKTDCAIVCGGLTADRAFSTGITVEVIGYEQTPNDDSTQKPVKAFAYTTLQNIQ